MKRDEKKEMAGEEFLGPSCLYDILSSRFKENPFILKRSLYHNEEKTSHVVNNGKLMIRLQFNEIIPSCRLWCYGVVKMRDKPYHAIQRAILTVGSTINISCLVEESVFSSDCDDFFFILFLSPSTATVDTLDKWCVRLLALADESCQAMTMSADEAAEPWKELTSVIMPCHTLLIDLHAGYIAKHRKAKRPSRSAFRSFMYPGTCSTQGMKWSKTLQCRFSPVDRAPHDVKDADITCDVTIALKRGQVQSNAMEGKAGSKRPRMISNTYSYLPSPALTVANSTLSSGTDNTVMVYHCISQNQEREEEEIRYERRTQVQCLWCRETFPCSSLNTKEQESNHGHEGKRSYLHSLGNLQRHLALFHTHFNYTMGLDKEGVCHVLVTRRYRHTTSGYDSPITNTKLASYELIVSQEGKQMQEAQSTQIRKTPRPFRSSFSSVRASNIRSLLQHTYYHVATGQKMMPKEVEIYLTSASASDEQHPEINLNNYELSATNAAVEEYVDINYYERQFMKLWNAHVQTFPPHGDTLLTLVVDCFAHRFGDIMVTKGLRHTFLVHLLSLWDFGLLTAEEVYYHINTVDKIKHAKKDQIDDMDKKC